jgi:hypothetical protein
VEFSGFTSAPGAWGTNNAWHMFGPVNFNLDQVMAFANEQEDSCIVEKLKWDMLDKKIFRVYIKNQKEKYKFHIIFSTTDGKLYHQEVEHDKKTILASPIPFSFNKLPSK